MKEQVKEILEQADKLAEQWLKEFIHKHCIVVETREEAIKKIREQGLWERYVEYCYKKSQN